VVRVRDEGVPVYESAKGRGVHAMSAPSMRPDSFFFLHADYPVAPGAFALGRSLAIRLFRSGHFGV
jgi:hypothetical protein